MSKPYLPAAALVAAVAATPLTHGHEASTCPVAYRDAAPLRLASTIGLDLAESISEQVVEQAISSWEACSGYGDEFPRFLIRGEGDRNFRVRFERRRPGNGHCATLFRKEIVLYRSARDNRGRSRPCGALEENLAHELGHVLGLGHSEDRRGCRRRIMSTISATHSRNLAGRSVHPDECTAVSEHWRTWAEHHEIKQRRAHPDTRLAPGEPTGWQLWMVEDSPASGVTTYTYNQHGELETTTDARSITVTRTIDALDRVTVMDCPEPALDTTYTYDDPLLAFSEGRLTAITRDGHTVSYEYDRFGRRKVAAYALGSLGDTSAAADLCVCLDNEDEDPAVRGQAAEALGYLRTESSFSSLEQAAEDASPEVRYWAVFALGQLGDQRAVPLLTRIAKEDRATVEGWGSVADEARAALDEV